MPTNSTLSGAQLVQLAADFSSLADQARDILTNPDLNFSANVSNALSSDMSTLSNIAANLAMWGAKIVFADSDSAFQTISSSTQAANAAVTKLQNDVKKINSVVTILGDAVSLGVSFGTGNWVSVVSAATSLGSAISSAGS
jgi:hypothetical protein